MTKAWSMKHAGTLSYGILGYWKKNFISFFLLQRLRHWKKEFYFFLFLHNLPISVQHNLHCIAKRGYSRPDQERHETQNSGSYCLKEINILHIYIQPLSTSRDNQFECPTQLVQAVWLPHSPTSSIQRPFILHDRFYFSHFWVLLFCCLKIWKYGNDIKGFWFLNHTFLLCIYWMWIDMVKKFNNCFTLSKMGKWKNTSGISHRYPWPLSFNRGHQIFLAGDVS